MGGSKDLDKRQALSYTQPSTSGIKTTAKARPFTSKKGKNPVSSGGSVPIKVIVADMRKSSKGISFQENTQTYITVTDETANVSYISEQIKAKLDRDITLVSGNGLSLDDEEGTKGLKFWRCPSRKVYAIPSQKRKMESVDTSSDSDTTEPKKHVSKQVKQFNSLKESMADIQGELSGCREILKDVVEISKGLPIPAPVMKLIKDAFRCKVCLSIPINPPVIATTCCETILGCAGCINNWYSGDGGLDKSCPQCRQSRGYAHTYQLKGIDEFLQGIKKILQAPSDN